MYHRTKETPRCKKAAVTRQYAGILDANPLTRSIYQYLLERKNGGNCHVTLFTTPEECLAHAEHTFDVLILDLDLLDDPEIFTQRLKRASPKLLLGALSDTWDQAKIAEALQAGFSGFFDRQMGAEEISFYLDQWHTHRACVVPRVAKDLVSLAKGALPSTGSSANTALTRREQEIRAYAVSGLTNQQIADRLFLSKSTVDNHFINIYRKLGIKNRRQLMRLDFTQGDRDFIPYFFPSALPYTKNKEDFKMNQQLSEIYAFFANIFMEAIPVPGESFTKALEERVHQMLTSDVNLLPDVREAFSAFLDDCQKDGLAQTQERLAVDRTMLFRGVRKEEGPLPPYESFYAACSACSKNENTLVQLGEMYRRGGLKLGKDAHERADYAGIELAFLSTLYRKEDESAHALAQEFLDEHVKCWLPAYCEAMLIHAQTAFFRGIAILLKCVILEQ